LWLSADRAERCTAPLTSGSSYRNSVTYRSVAEQFGLDVHPRWKPSPGTTWCNLFLADFTRACGCEVPREIGGVYLRALHQILWLRGELRRSDLSSGKPAELYPLQGAHHGWAQVDELGARSRADRGMPTVATWINPVRTASSHVAAVMPSSGGATYIAQAGARCFAYGPLAAGFGDLRPLQFFTHD
jgi:hypothetical protein